MKLIADILTEDRVRDIQADTKDEAIEELCNMLRDAPEVTDPDKFYHAIMYRETIMSTGIGMGIAVPHSKTSSLNDFVMAVGRTKKGIEFDSLDGLPVHIIILIGASDTQGEEFLKILAQIGSVLKDENYSKKLIEADSPKDMLKLLTPKR